MKKILYYEDLGCGEYNKLYVDTDTNELCVECKNECGCNGCDFIVDLSPDTINALIRDLGE